MEIDTDENQPGIRIHRKWWIMLTRIPFILFQFLITAGFIFAADLLFSVLTRSVKDPPGVFILILVSFFSVIVLITLHIYSIGVFIATVFLNYIKIYPWGIEYRNWPYYGIRSRWENIERKGKYSSFGVFSASDTLFIKNAEPFGRQIMIFSRHKPGSRKEEIIPLTEFQGWPDGVFFQLLHAYIPGIIFKEVPKEKNGL